MADSKLAGVLLDVDGTLVDTTYIHALTWWEAVRQTGRDVPMARVHRAIGMGADNLLEFVLGEKPDEETDKRLRTAHATRYAEYWPRLRRLPGARELVYALAERGLRVVLASSADGDELDMLRGVIGADEAILAATSASDAARSKPAPDILHAALDKSGLRASEVVLVGDSVWDIQAAARLSIPCVAVTCGGTSRCELQQAGAVAVYHDPADLLSQLSTSPIGRAAARV